MSEVIDFLNELYPLELEFKKIIWATYSDLQYDEEQKRKQIKLFFSIQRI